jgi:hypothetical protein
MFKLGQQNFSIEQKIDQILESIESGGALAGNQADPSQATIYQSPGFSGVSIKGSSGSYNRGASDKNERAERSESSEQAERPSSIGATGRSGLKPVGGEEVSRRPSDLLKARQAEDAPKSEERKEPEDIVHVRRPSDLLNKSAGKDTKDIKEPKESKEPPVESVKSVRGMEAPKVMAIGKDSATVDPASPSKTTAKASAKPEPEPSKDATASAGAGPSTGPPPPGVIRTFPYPSDGTLKCPYCGEQNFQEMENRAKIISFVPVKKYGKKYYCKQCRGNWDYDMA